MSFQLPKLEYSYDSLEPYVDAQTMEIHHTKHHAAYTDKLNGAIQGTSLEGKSIEEILKNISAHSAAVRNNGGGFYNHNLFWKIMGPGSSGTPAGDLASAIDKHFGSLEKFKEEFLNAAATRFGSGWAWLVKTQGGLKITSTPNQDNPLMDVVDVQGTPLLGLDVWEHAYYLKYQNKRPEYIKNWWNVVNWKEVEKLYKG
ncbi:MAG: superoxide dismutase [Bacteroidota bacterium]